MAPDFGSPSEWDAFKDVNGAVDEEFDLCPQSDIFPCLSETLYDSEAKLRPQLGFKRGGIRDFVGIVGSDLATPLRICHDCEAWPDGIEDGESDIAGLEITPQSVRQTNGDVNLPVFSANQGDEPDNPPGYDVDFLFPCGISHTELMSDPDVVSRTVSYLTGDAELPSSDGIFHEFPCELSSGSD